MNAVEGTATLASWISMVAIALALVVVWMLFCRRTRRLALGLLGVAALGMLFLRVSHRPSPVRVYDGEIAHLEPMFDVHQQQAFLVQADQAEILRNQRMAAQMDDAFVQKSPDGSTLETYPDGMQIRQRWPDGFRSIVRSANGGGSSSSHSTHSEIRLWILGAPFLALLLAFVALKSAKRGGRSGMTWIVVGGVALLFLSFLFWGSARRNVTVVEAIPQPTSPSASRSPTKNVWSGSDAQVAETPLGVQRVQQDVAKVFEEVYSQRNEATAQESIETIWAKLTQPKINLDPPADAETKATQRELANAARVILSTSAPGADPFTQGWLMNAAKAIMSATPKGNSNAHEAGIAEIAAPAAAVAVVQTPDKVRPDWIDNPPKLAGDTRRVVVSTDPLQSNEECQAQLEKRLRFAVADRVRELAKQATGQSTVNSPMLADMGISPDFILRELCPEGAYVETVSGSDGKLKRTHALIDFTPQKDELLLNRWQVATGTPQTRLVAAEAPPRANSYTTGERPAWVDQPPKLVGNTRRVVVSTDPYSTVEECHAALRDKLRGVVQARVDELARAANGGHYASTPGLDSMGINIEYILSELCPEDDYIETVNASFGEMKRAHALVEFNEAQDRFLLDRWRAHARVQSIEVVAVLSAFVVGGLAFVYGLLKVDTWTRGYYTKRLFLGVPAAIIAIAVGLIAFIETFG